MKCQECNEPATVHVTEIIADNAVEYHLCDAHARELESLHPKSSPTSAFASFLSDAKLIETLRDPFARQKFAAHLLPALCLALLDESPQVRIAAAFRLMCLGPEARSTAGALRDAMSDRDEHVRKAAEIALRFIENEETAPWLF